MSTVFLVLRHTPVWVYLLFGYLVAQGVRRLGPRVSRSASIAVVPAVFIVWGLVGLAHRPFSAGRIAALWLAGAVLGGLLGLATGPVLLAADRESRLVSLPGSWVPLARNVVFFGLHYGLRVAAAMLPIWYAPLIQADVAVSGGSAGYFVAWGALLVRRYRHAPQVRLQAPRRSRP
jgi:hypothetical protein